MDSRLTIGRETTLCMSLSGRPGTFGSRFHNHLYGALGLDFVYKAFSTRDLAAAIAGIRALGVRGCAISMPFKEACIPLLDELAPSARAIESVNTIVNDDGKLTGHNTDYGTIAPLLARHGVSPDTTFALHGSGGMAKAVAAALRDHGYTQGTIVARNADTGRALAQTCGLRYARTLDISARMLINVTPVGMTGPNANELPFSEQAIDAAEIVFDVVALPVQTPFVRRAQGKRVINGGDVIALQAVAQFVLYTGVTPSDAQVEAARAYALG
jgi:shikimate dehydrogenase